ncbi:MAG: carbamoyltransferase HypF, partial [Acidobacteria bacterium]|nr:carbamoyltransferase HypF [Acidobacteriota bacterium]
AASALAAGQIVAIKGLGGFHLACDATNPAAIAELRRRKRRDEKPFAVMVRDVSRADALAEVTDDERRLLMSIERPIVLLRRRASAPVADSVAPGNPLIGLMLPYTPLHHLLMAAVDRPLVMTSGNLSDEPLAYRNDEAVARLGAIADVFLLHDREIDTRCDDSVTRVIAGAPVVLRRSRGYVPRGVTVSTPFTVPVLACGALLKNTFCVGVGDAAYLGPHIGDLENLETYEAFEHAIARMERFLGARIGAIAHDLHPDYLSTRYARSRSEATKIAVQHHHAHVASVMAEHGLDGRVVGVAYDGTGYGTDGAAWGGEILVADYTRFSRAATFRPIRLAGGDTAIRQVWRQALALLDDAFDGAPPIDRLPVFADIARRDLTTVQQMLDQRINTPMAHGVGRYFDAIGAIGLARVVARFEGQVAMEWNLIADPMEDGVYEFELGGRPELVEIDLRLAVRALTADLIDGRSPARVSARFHNTLAAATADAVTRVLAGTGRIPVVLTGGVFQNARLAESVPRLLGPHVDVLRHATVPPGDGGIALGQAVIASAVLASGSQVVSEGLCA